MRIIALAAILAVASCSGVPSAPSSPALTGTWRIQSYLTGAQPIQAFPPQGLAYQVTFDGGSRLSARLDCNTCNGSFTQAGSSLVIDPALACTRAACTNEFVNRDLLSILAGHHEMSERLGHITLRSERGTMLLSPQ